MSIMSSNVVTFFVIQQLPVVVTDYLMLLKGPCGLDAPSSAWQPVHCCDSVPRLVVDSLVDAIDVVSCHHCVDLITFRRSCVL